MRSITGETLGDFFLCNRNNFPLTRRVLIFDVPAVRLQERSGDRRKPSRIEIWSQTNTCFSTVNSWAIIAATADKALNVENVDYPQGTVDRALSACYRLRLTLESVVVDAFTVLLNETGLHCVADGPAHFLE